MRTRNESSWITLNPNTKSLTALNKCWPPRLLASWRQPFPSAMMPTFLDAMAQLRATFWKDPRLQHPHLGLNDVTNVLDIIPEARRYTGNSLGALLNWIRTGWDVMKDMLPSDVYAQIHDLVENPHQLIDAVQRYTTTLLHGDFRKENLAHTGKPVFLTGRQWLPRVMQWMPCAGPVSLPISIRRKKTRTDVHVSRIRSKSMGSESWISYVGQTQNLYL